MLEVIKELLINVTGNGDITYDTDLVKDLRLNSFDVSSLICEFEERYDIEIPTRDIWKLRTVRDIIDYLASIGIVA